MFKFFSFKERQKKNEDKINSLLIAKLDRLIELLEKQQKESNSGNIHLEHVQVDHLENIIFRLDSIEIDELSGKLLIGNNISGPEDFGSSLVQKMDKENAKKESASKTAHPKQNMTKTSKGYSFRNES